MNVKNDLSEKECIFGGCALVFSSVASLFAHEYSHMVAVNALFTNANPYITCSSYFPTMNCSCNWIVNAVRPELSITYETARGIVAAAGPICDVTNIAISSVVAWKIRQSNKKISSLFAVHAFCQALNLFLYSLRSLRSPSSGNDFANVHANLGIPCIIQAAIAGSIAWGSAMLMKRILLNPMEIKEKKKLVHMHRAPYLL